MARYSASVINAIVGLTLYFGISRHANSAGERGRRVTGRRRVQRNPPASTPGRRTRPPVSQAERLLGFAHRRVHLGEIEAQQFGADTVGRNRAVFDPAAHGTQRHAEVLRYLLASTQFSGCGEAAMTQ